MHVYKLVHPLSSRSSLASVTQYALLPVDDLFDAAYQHHNVARLSFYDIRLITPDSDDAGERLTFFGSATYSYTLSGVSVSSSCVFGT